MPKQQPKKKKLETVLANADDILSAIMDVNERLDSGTITVEHARALTGNLKAATKLIDSEIDIAKFTGRTDKTIKRWFHRVASSEVEQAIPASLLEQIQTLLAANKETTEPTGPNGKKKPAAA